MCRATVIALLLGCMPLIAVAAGQENATTEVPLEELALNVGALDTWGTRTYSYQVVRGGETSTLGTVTMKTTLRGEQVELHDTWELKWHGKDVSLDLRQECDAGNLLRPTSIESLGQGEDEFETFTVAVAGEEAVVTAENGTREVIALPSDTLTFAAMFRVFTLLPREKGAAVGVGHVLEVSEMHLEGPAVILYEGTDQVELDGRDETLHKFVYKRDTRLVEEAWVDDAGVLRRIRLDGRKVLTEMRDAN